MEVVAFAMWIAFGVVCVLGVAVRVRKACLHSHLRSLRDLGEHRYQRVDQHVDQHVTGAQLHSCA